MAGLGGKATRPECVVPVPAHPPTHTATAPAPPLHPHHAHATRSHPRPALCSLTPSSQRTRHAAAAKPTQAYTAASCASLSPLAPARAPA
jgi:hypothetical protein